MEQRKEQIKTGEVETRLFSGMEMRADDETRAVSGYGAVFNQKSEVLYGFFREIIAPGAFDEADVSDVRALFNHDPNLILGRSKAGTLATKTDETGFNYRFDMPETTYGNDLLVSMRRGDITQSSFAFTVETDTWGIDSDGMDLRTITKISRVYDISPVTYPAYPDAGAGLGENSHAPVISKRCLEHIQQRKEEQGNPGMSARARSLFFIDNSNK